MIWIILSVAGAVLILLPLLYLGSIAPRMIAKPNMGAFRSYFYAHRGLYNNRSEAPENSLEAFKRAVEAGYGMELDVRLTKDRIPVVFHDETLERMCGQSGRVCDYTYEELKAFKLGVSEERIPLFADVLKLVDGRTPLIVELKIETMETTLCPIADKLLSGYKGLYCIESFNPLALWWYRLHRGKVARGQLSTAFAKDHEGNGPHHFAIQELLLNFISKPDFIAYNFKHSGILSRRICCNVFGATAVAWTIRSEADLQKARKQFDLFIFEGFRPCQS